MDENKNLVTEEVAENVEQTTEQTPKLYTEAEMQAYANEVAGKRVARKEAKIRKEYERKYGDLEEVLMAGTGKKSVDDLTDTFRGFYESKGISVPKKKTEYSDSDIELLAKADAEAIISGGFDEVLEEADRLNALGAERMTPREKALFVTLTNHIKDTETGRELSELGVTEDVYGSKEFKDFAAKFNPKTPMRDIYDIYAKTQPKKEIKTMGSMKNTASAESAVKEFYTPEEARKFTKKDFDNNPALYEAVLQSMQKWK